MLHTRNRSKDRRWSTEQSNRFAARSRTRRRLVSITLVAGLATGHFVPPTTLSRFLLLPLEPSWSYLQCAEIQFAIYRQVPVVIRDLRWASCCRCCFSRLNVTRGPGTWCLQARFRAARCSINGITAGSQSQWEPRVDWRHKAPFAGSSKEPHHVDFQQHPAPVRLDRTTWSRGARHRYTVFLKIFFDPFWMHSIIVWCA